MLALDFRPHRFSDIVGQRHIVPVLRAMARDRTVPTALVFSGSRGTGKTTSGRILAAALNCEEAPSRKGDPCLECASCKAIRKGNAMAVIEMDAASHGLVEDIRKLREDVQYDHGGWRVVLLDEVQSMLRPAFNALLKILEEPPERTCFILLTTEPGKIPDTVLSRSMSFDFRRLSLADITGRLREVSEARGKAADEALLTEVARRARGGMRDAVMLLEQAWRAGVEDTAGLREMLGDPDVAPKLISAAREGDLARAHACVAEHFERTGDGALLMSDLVSLVRDLMILKTGGEPKGLSDADLELRRTLAARCTDSGLVGTMRVLWDVRSRVRPGEWDQWAVADMAAVMISEALQGRHRTSQADTPVEGQENGSRTISLARMAEMAREA